MDERKLSLQTAEIAQKLRGFFRLQVSGEAEDFQDLLFDLWRWREEIKAER